ATKAIRSHYSILHVLVSNPPSASCRCASILLQQALHPPLSFHYTAIGPNALSESEYRMAKEQIADLTFESLGEEGDIVLPPQATTASPRQSQSAQISPKPKSLGY